MLVNVIDRCVRWKLYPYERNFQNKWFQAQIARMDANKTNYKIVHLWLNELKIELNAIECAHLCIPITHCSLFIARRYTLCWFLFK